MLAQPAPASAAAPEFVTVLQRNLKAWDKDRNNQLNPTEVDAALADPKLTGDDAAAIATIKSLSRDDSYRIRRVDIATIKDDIRLNLPANRGNYFNDDWFSPDWQKGFEEARARGQAFRSGGALGGGGGRRDSDCSTRYFDIEGRSVRKLRVCRSAWRRDDAAAEGRRRFRFDGDKRERKWWGREWGWWGWWGCLESHDAAVVAAVWNDHRSAGSVGFDDRSALGASG